MKVFGNIATKLSRNPLGIIALLIVLVYGIAGFVATSDSFQPAERVTLVVFMVLFPLIVLIALYKLVTKHHDKLYAPSDFSNEDNFVKLIENKIEASPKIQEIDRKTEQVKEEVSPLVSKASDDDDTDQNHIKGYKTSAQTNEDVILRILRDGPYSYRSSSGLAKEAGIDNKNNVRNILFELKEKKLVGKLERGRGTRYFLTDNGRALLKEKGI